MIGPDLRSSAFQVLSALAVTENRSARGNMAPVAKAKYVPSCLSKSICSGRCFSTALLGVTALKDAALPLAAPLPAA